ncbi:succinylglutamate desuccinylase [Paraglaciecola sp. MB-3u-78]|uniref:succinylglutamate desuccinylase n=1 Tax=Paraglaciecola sp. MB-3u-78 TaxID=2058332 RepID=UPI000C3315EE|nr:succinylglutamate desuccinylase [Paraglaciecola sp. MB-3u-78]PKG99200.1 succinylglutamate desuccinylase [Paraglaciecola sp. MB-3u-78]
METQIDTSIQNTIQTLKQQGNFLSLSRTQPALFSTSFQFFIDAHTQVNVLAEGIISFETIAKSDKDIVLSCGVHGNETAPIEICDDLVKNILLGKTVVKQRVLFLFGNLPAMDIAERFIEENMNRLFSGEHQNLAAGQQMNHERRRAKQLEDVVKNFYLGIHAVEGRSRFHYDLHTAIRASKNDKFAVYPFQNGKAWDKYQLQILLACGVNTILLSGSPTTTFSYYSVNELNANAFTVELGKVMPFGQNNMDDFSDVVNTLTKLICGVELGLKHFTDSDFLIYEVNQVINKQQDDFVLNFAADAPNFSDFPKDYLLAHETNCEYRTQFEGEAIVFPNADVEIGQRALLTVIPTNI